MDLKRGIDKGVTAVVDERQGAQPRQSHPAETAQVGTILPQRAIPRSARDFPEPMPQRVWQRSPCITVEGSQVYHNRNSMSFEGHAVRSRLRTQPVVSSQTAEKIDHELVKPYILSTKKKHLQPGSPMAATAESPWFISTRPLADYRPRRRPAGEARLPPWW